MKFKIGIFGSAIDDHKIDQKKVEELANELSNHQVSIITGGCSGVPYQVAFESAKRGIYIYGYTPELNMKGQKKFTPNDDLSIYKKIHFTPKTFEKINDKETRKKYRNVISTANCDAGIIIAGRWGTMNEFTNLYDIGKVIGVLTKTGGIADELPQLCRKINKETKAKVYFSASPSQLVKKIIGELKKRKI